MNQGMRQANTCLPSMILSIVTFLNSSLVKKLYAKPVKQVAVAAKLSAVDG